MMDKLRKFLSKKLAVQEQFILPDKTLDDLGADSLDRLEVMMDLCEEFGIDNISDERIAKVKTVGDLYQLIKEEKGERSEEAI